MITRCALGLALVLGSACVPWTSMAPDKPAVRLLLDPPRDLVARTADGDSLPLGDIAEVVGRVVGDSSDTIAVMATTVRRAGAESPSGVPSGSVVAVRRDSTVRLQVISAHPQAVEIGITVLTGVVLAIMLVYASTLGGGGS